MKPSKCNRCDRKTLELSAAICGHLACTQCVRGNKPLRKCEECCQSNYLKSRNLSQEKSKKKNQMKSQQMSRKKIDDHLQKTERKPFKTISDNQSQQHVEFVYCRQHSEPFSMYCTNSKKVLCAVCLYKMNGYSNVLPIKNAEQTLRKQNKIQRQQSGCALDEVKRAYNLCKNNREILQQYLRTQMQIIQNTYKTLQKALRQSFQKNTLSLRNFFTLKLNECDQVLSDLDYLSNTLMEYRNNNKDNISLGQSIFVYESYQIIRKTLNNIDLDFNNYEGKQPKLVSFNFVDLIDKIDKMITFKLDLPLRKSDRKIRSMSARQAEILTGLDEEGKNIRAKSRKDKTTHFLYGNLEDDFDDSLYKRMLRMRFKGT